MRTASLILLALATTVGGCSSTGGPYPSLRPRAAEAIDPRVQPFRPVNDRPVRPALTERLSALLGEAESGDAAFQSAITKAERLAASAGAPHSESWINAEEALTVAVAARRPTATAQADVDAIGATALQTQGGIAPNELKAIDSAANEIAAISQRQADRIDAIKKRLGT